MASHHTQTVLRYARNKVDLQKRLEESGWGFFLLMIGILLVLPSEFVPRGAWLVGTGVIILALNCIRYLNNVAVSRFTMVLGVIAIVAGLTEFFSGSLPFLPGLLALTGLSILVKSMLPKNSSTALTSPVMHKRVVTMNGAETPRRRSKARR